MLRRPVEFTLADLIAVMDKPAAHTLLANLATMARNTITTAINPNYPLIVVTRPTTSAAEGVRSVRA